MEGGGCTAQSSIGSVRNGQAWETQFLIFAHKKEMDDGHY